MRYNWWDRKRAAFHDKAFQRAELPPWDARWHALSVAARAHFLSDVKVSKPRYQGVHEQPRVPADRFPDAVLDELVKAGFVTVHEPAGRERVRQVSLVKEAVDFLNRQRALRRYHLLDPDQPSELAKYISYCFTTHELTDEINRVLHAAGINLYSIYGDVYETYVTRRRWPGWVAQYLDEPLAQPILDAITDASGRLPLAEVAGRLPGQNPGTVRAILDKLIARLAVFEDLDPRTQDIVVGFLPAVWEDRERASQPRQRPPLEPCAPPAEPGPESGTDIPDLRAVLLELAAGRARLRQDGSLFQKEFDRFLTVLDVLPRWLVELYRLTPERRLDVALHWAKRLHFTRQKKEGERYWLDLGERGQKWLGDRVEAQYAFFYDSLRNPNPPDEPFSSAAYDDSVFLGAQVVVCPSATGRHTHLVYGRVLTPEQRQPLRDALHAAFAELPVGVFHRLDNFVAHACFDAHNPLLLGRKPEEVEVRVAGRFLPPLEEQLHEVARHLFGQMVSNRLIPLGCLQAGQDADGELLLARRPRLDAYFGRAPAVAEPAAEPATPTRVVVQPDFSVIVIGHNLAPAAELAPFCERVKGHTGTGTVTFKITRASILKAAAAGLTEADILDRLERHSSTPLPGNVVHEVRDWSGWVRTVTAASATVIRCPDAAAADRVLAALGRGAERLNEKTVAFAEDSLGEAERRKLLEQGIIVTRSEAARQPNGRKRKRRR